jgi:hypothetical protein
MKASTWNTPGRAFEHSPQRFSVEEVRILLVASSSEESISAVSGLFKKAASSAAYLSYVRNSSGVKARWCVQMHVKK